MIYRLFFICFSALLSPCILGLQRTAQRTPAVTTVISPAVPSASAFSSDADQPRQIFGPVAAPRTPVHMVSSAARPVTAQPQVTRVSPTLPTQPASHASHASNEGWGCITS